MTGPVSLRLNQIPADPGGTSDGRSDLASSPAEKRAAARAIEDHIAPDTLTAGDRADGETDSAVKELGPKDGHEWLASASFEKAHRTWGEQVQNLLNRPAAEKAALRGTNPLLQSTDFGIDTGLRQSSNLDGY